jgi:hypothetical protein
MALPTALFAMVASMGLASAAVLASVDAQQGTTRDHYAKEAIAAADAGASVALLRLNRYANALNSSTPCLKLNNGMLAMSGAEADGWCPAITGSVGGATYSYRATPQVSNSTMSVVATGTDGTVSRRIDVTLKGSTAGSALAQEGMIGLKKVTLGGNANVRVNVGSNGYVDGEGNNAIACGNIRHGVGKAPNSENKAPKQCNGYSVTESEVQLPPVSSLIPPTIATSNSDYRLVTCTKTPPEVKQAEPTGCQLDTYTGNWKTKPPWNPATRTISLSGGKEGHEEATLTLGGGDYFICRLEMTGGHLIMAAGANVRLFFDTPEHCGLSSPAEQVSVTGKATIEATGYKPELHEFDMPGLYLLGSSTIETKVNLAGQAGTNEIFVYAPSSKIEISGNANYKGVIAGKEVSDTGNGTMSQDAGYEPKPIGGATIYSRQSYIECTGATASPPNANC